MTKGNPRGEQRREKQAIILKIIGFGVIAAFFASSLLLGPKRGNEANGNVSDGRAQSILTVQTDAAGSSTDTEICLTPELDGSWVLEHNKTYIDPICCDGDDKLYRYSPKECGHVRPAGDFLGDPTILAYMRGHGCRCTKFFNDQHTWKSPALPEWDAHDFCERLGERKILLVGDSTMSQSATTLMNAVHPAGCQVQMVFALTDTLIMEELGFLNRGSYWTDSIMKHRPDIVIFSSGPHIYGDSNYTRLHDALLADIDFLRRAPMNITFVWKTQQAPGCTKEMSAMHPFEAARQLPHVAELSYNHADFFRRDSESIRIMQQHNVAFADLRMLYSRSDAHMMAANDCLHFCSPGPLEIFPVVMHQLLKTDFAVSPCLHKKHG